MLTVPSQSDTRRVAERDALEFIRRETDRCVKCALCAPHCPTYLATLDENESPRGRIALIQGLASQQLRPSAPLRTHLDHCLACRACEKVCPSGVRYGALLDRARHYLLPPQRPARALAGILAAPRPRALLHAFTRLLRGSGLLAVLQTTRLIARLGLRRAQALIDLLPRSPVDKPTSAPAPVGTRGQVVLFTGCTGRLLDAATLNSARRVLSRLGFHVIEARHGTCCGALHAHQGDGDTALRLARETMAQYQALVKEAVTDDGGEDVPLIYVATGCGAQLVEYPDLPWPDVASRQAAQAFAARVEEISTFLLPRLRAAEIPLSPRAEIVHVHEPCSQRNVLRQTNLTRELLALIPQLEVRALPDNAHCCGGAGAYMVEQPQQAQRIFALKKAAIDASGEQVRRMVTSNPGCAVMFRRAGMEVRHPLEVIAGQLDDL
ncbi:MAG TPA: (Fe-S)-binding protein [Gammaproteobacteria bacterium]|nr:(Fe-S)-binding protein [Gammaproteobacteria bacterium]